MIRITISEVEGSRGRPQWEATAMYAGNLFRVRRSACPVRDALRAVIDGTPGFADSPWQLLRGTRVDLFGPSAMKMAASSVEEGPAGTVMRRDKAGIAAIYDPFGSAMGADSGEGEEGAVEAVARRASA